MMQKVAFPADFQCMKENGRNRHTVDFMAGVGRWSGLPGVVLHR